MAINHFREFSNILKKKYPEYKVSVRLTRVPKDRMGDCRKIEDGSFIIRVSKELEVNAAIQILIHEWAHVLSWDTSKRKAHGINWGKKYSVVYEVYRAWVEEV